MVFADFGEPFGERSGQDGVREAGVAQFLREGVAVQVNEARENGAQAILHVVGVGACAGRHGDRDHARFRDDREAAGLQPVGFVNWRKQ